MISSAAPVGFGIAIFLMLTRARIAELSKTRTSGRVGQFTQFQLLMQPLWMPEWHDGELPRSNRIKHRADAVFDRAVFEMEPPFSKAFVKDHLARKAADPRAGADSLDALSEQVGNLWLGQIRDRGDLCWRIGVKTSDAIGSIDNAQLDQLIFERHGIGPMAVRQLGRANQIDPARTQHEEHLFMRCLTKDKLIAKGFQLGGDNGAGSLLKGHANLSKNNGITHGARSFAVTAGSNGRGSFAKFWMSPVEKVRPVSPVFSRLWFLPSSR